MGGEEAGRGALVLLRPLAAVGRGRRTGLQHPLPGSGGQPALPPPLGVKTPSLWERRGLYEVSDGLLSNGSRPRFPHL